MTEESRLKGTLIDEAGKAKDAPPRGADKPPEPSHLRGTLISSKATTEGDAKESRLRGTLIDAIRERIELSSKIRIETPEDFAKRIFQKGVKFSSEASAYEVIAFDESKGFIRTKMRFKDKSTSEMTRNFNLAELWKYYQENRIDFED